MGQVYGVNFIRYNELPIYAFLQIGMYTNLHIHEHKDTTYRTDIHYDWSLNVYLSTPIAGAGVKAAPSFSLGLDDCGDSFNSVIDFKTQKMLVSKSNDDKSYPFMGIR